MATETETAMRSSSAGCPVRRVVVLAVATSLLAACAAPGSEIRSPELCPALVTYSAKFRERAAGEIALLPDESAILEMLSDYSVMRDQARICKEMLAGL